MTNKFLSSLMGLASMTLMFALHTEAKTGLANNYETNRALLETRHARSCTVSGVVDQLCVEKGLAITGTMYVPTVNTEKRLYPELAKRLGLN